MAALALLCYTELGGKLKFSRKKPNGTDHSSENFNLFFDDLGPGYKEFRAAGHNVYDTFRCGLTHEYYVKKSCAIKMLVGTDFPNGTGQTADGKYYFVVEQYCLDLEHAFAALEAHLYPEAAAGTG